ncbi:MAG: ABC transporter permease [Solirubrobacteraceae bacterium]|nr:ABC transporter permease [Solirubrobacteraceae bacterium]
MSALVDGLRDGIHLVVTGDPQLYDTIGNTLSIAGRSTLIATLLGVPLGCWAALGGGRSHRWVRLVLAAGLRLPPVAVGLVLWLLMWPDSRWGGGPLAGLGWIYTTNAIVLAQTVLALPLVAALVAGGVEAVPGGLIQQARALGARPLAIAALAMREARPAVIGAILAGFGTSIAVVGAILVVGSGLSDATLATAALASWNAGGADAHAVANGLVLLALFVLVAAGATSLQHRRTAWTQLRS